MPLISPRDEYTQMIVPIDGVRDAVRGQYAVKRKSYIYLPHPSELDSTSIKSINRYKTYMAGAEFDEFPSQTLSATLGKFKMDAATIELPSSVEYLEEDANGDGQSMRALMELSASEVLQVKWQVLVSEYQGLSGLDISQMSKADVDALAPRSSIKSYRRESVIDWEFERKNGVMQLVYIVFREEGYEFNPETRVRKEVKTDLILALDEEGNYYQQKNVDGADGEKDYVTVGGQPLKWLPVTIIADQELESGKLPEALGFLSPIVDLAYARYRVSADYKEAMRSLPPTTYTKGWKSGDMDTFREANGRDYIETGAGSVNNLPGEVDVTIEGADTELGGYERYFQDNERRVRALGGVFTTDDQGDRTATEASIDSAERVAKLENIASSIERGYKRAVLYCAMFEGTYAPDQLESAMDDVTIDLPRDFAKAKLSPEEVDRIILLVDRGLMTTDQAVSKLVEGGWHGEDAQQIIDELTLAGPAPALDEPQAVPA